MIKLRKHLCWLLGHRYKAIWLRSSLLLKPGEGVGIADTEAGCVFCGDTEPNNFPINISEIDWEATKHRTEPPKHNTYDKPF